MKRITRSVTISIVVSAPLVTTQAEQDRAAQHISQQITAYTLAAAARDLGLPQPSSSYDARIAGLAQQTLYSYDQLASVLKQIALSLGVSVDQCLAFIDNDVARLSRLAYSAYATKLWYAVSETANAALARVLDDRV